MFLTLQLTGLWRRGYGDYPLTNCVMYKISRKHPCVLIKSEDAGFITK